MKIICNENNHFYLPLKNMPAISISLTSGDFLIAFLMPLSSLSLHFRFRFGALMVCHLANFFCGLLKHKLINNSPSFETFMHDSSTCSLKITNFTRLNVFLT